MQDWVDIVDGWKGIKMKTWEQYYIEQCVTLSQPWDKKLGWCIWHSCFDYLHGCTSEYAVLSGVWS